LATLASGIAAGVSSGSTAGAATGALAGKNAVENNFLGKTSSDKLFDAIDKIKAGDKSLATANELIKMENADQRSEMLLDKFKHDPSSLLESEQIELNAYVRVYAAEMESAHGPDEAKRMVQGLFANTGYKRNPDTEVLNQAEGIVNTWGYHKSNASIGDAPLIMAGSVLGLTIKGMAANAAIGVGVNAGVQLTGKDPFNYVDVIMAGMTAALTTGKGFVVSTPINIGGAAVGSSIKGEDPTNSAVGAGLGSLGGSGTSAVISGALGSSVKAGASEAVSAIGGSLAGEAVGNIVKGVLDEAEKNNKK
ncbi:VENN motif pre-toxin domain-containing protein, partial [Pantoea allii]|uniref:VENN motif pre-toxin domain-containing protein n=1 Tax=Pantoea allii TaxID=574096 RepID=UPI0024B64EA5